MPYHKSCEKRMRTAEKANERNRKTKSLIRSACKKVRLAKDKNSAYKALQTAFSILDKAVKRGVIHHKNAANKKSTLSLAANKIVSA